MSAHTSERSDREFWDAIAEKVKHDLEKGLPEVSKYNSLSETDAIDWEIPTSHIAAKHSNGFHSEICPTCGDSFSTFPLLLLHQLETHAHFGRDLLTSLKHGQDVRHIR
jgi:hypothetical protein